MAQLSLYETRSMSPQAQQLFVMTNNQRAQGITCQGKAYPPSVPLQEDSTLTAAAQHRADDMAATGEFSHTPANGKTYVYWLNVVHYTVAFPAVSNTGENLSMGGDVQSTFESIKASTSGHCEAQLTGVYLRASDHAVMPGFTRIGIAQSVSASGVRYWAVLFAN